MNIHGYCPNCNSNMDGDLVIEYPASQGKTEKEVIDYASSYAGWTDWGIFNRWDRRVGIYDMYQDRTIQYRCPDCNYRIPGDQNEY